MIFKKITAYKEENVQDQESWDESVYTGLQQKISVGSWLDILFAFNSVEGNEDLDELYSFLQENGECIDEENQEVKVYQFDENKFALIDSGSSIGIAIRKSDLDDFLNMI